MKVNFQSIKMGIKNLPWQKIGQKAGKMIKYTSLGVVTLGSVALCGINEEMKNEEKAKYQNLIKERDINRYNKMCEDIALDNEYDCVSYWEEGYNAMTDSIRIADRAYFEGAQMVRDSIKNVNK